jgi:hypothetical protein
MAGVPEQGRTAIGPFRERVSSDQRPFVWRIDIANDLVNIFVSAGEVGGAFLARSGIGP